MADPWLPGATRLPLSDTGDCDAAYPPKAIAHITWDKNATKAAPQPLVAYESLQSYFHGGGASVAPHILWDPFTGRFTQYYPANSRSKSVVDAAGGTRTNRAGKVVIQIEALFFPWCVVAGKAYERLVDTPCKGWDALHAWVKSWGVPDAWPMGRPVNFDSHRSESVWETRGGWYGHSQVPENDHQDPGSWPDFTMEDDMPLTPADATTVWAFKNTKAGDTTDMHQKLVNVEAQSRENGRALTALAAKVDTALAAPAPVIDYAKLAAALIAAVAKS